MYRDMYGGKPKTISSDGQREFFGTEGPRIEEIVR